MTKEAFLDAYPEFVVADSQEPALVPAKLAEAEKNVSDIWGDKRDDIVGLTAAHLLAISPFGRNAKLSSEKGTSTWGDQLKARRRAFGCALGRQG